MDVPTAFALFGAIIVVGFLGAMLFQRLKIPDVLILIFLGMLIGPISFFFGWYWLSIETIKPYTSYFAAVALLIILFEGGLYLNFDKVLQTIGPAFMFTVSIFVLNILVSAILFIFLLHLPFLLGIMLGAICGGTSGAIVVPLVSRLSVKEETKVILTLESVLTDVICVVVVIAILQYINMGNVDTGTSIVNAAKQIAAAFSVAIVIGLIFGIFWLWLLKKLAGKPYAFMMTMAVLFLLYAFTETAGGNGAMAGLIFGMVLGNKEEIARIFKIKTEFVLDERIKEFESEVSFFVRTFFFVYLGLMFSFTSITYWVVGAILILIAGLMGVRLLTTMVLVTWKREVGSDWQIMATMFPRGLAAAVLATLPTSSGISGTENFVGFTFLVILFTNIIPTAATFVFERKKLKENSKSNRQQKILSSQKNS
ncbi:MAG: cation:proton antiporter [Thermoplasmata archaeon]